MLTAKFSNVSEWRSSLRSIGKINSEIMFSFNKEGIVFRGMDPTHVALIELNFPKSSFDEYDCRESFFRINIKEFLKSMIGTKKNDSIELIIKRKKSLKIKINNELKHEIKLTEVEESRQNSITPRIDVKSKISVVLDLLEDILVNIEKDSKQLMINSLENGVEFSGKGGNLENRFNLEKGSINLPFHDIEEESISCYDVKFMAKIIKTIGKNCKIVNIEYGNQTPVKMLFEMPSSVKTEYYLAPRVEY